MVVPRVDFKSSLAQPGLQLHTLLPPMVEMVAYSVAYSLPNVPEHPYYSRLSQRPTD